MSKTQITLPLEIPDVRVLKTEINADGAVIINVERIKKETRCRKCGRTITKFQGYDDWVPLATWWEAITAFFVARANSGFVEGLNNKLKVLKRRCYGLFNRQHWFQRIFFDLEGYRLFGLA